MARIGSIRCPAPGCGNGDATVSETAAGTLNIGCHRCQFSAYGKAGTRAKRLIEAATTLDDDAPRKTPAPPAPAAPAAAPKAAPPKAPAKTPTPAPTTPPAAAPKASGGFNLSQL